jgi:transcriptional regulator with XRE-family HTH domain
MPARPYPRTVRNAIQLLGAQIRAGRLDRGWSVVELAQRAGVSEKTVRSVENGDAGVAIGTVLDCAVLVGVPLFYDDERRLAAEVERGRAPLIGRRVRRSPQPDVDLDF